MPGIVDELLYIAAGAATAKLTKEVAKKYADPKASMNFASLKGFGKPSTYSHVGLGAVATGYAVNQAQKRGRLDDEEYFLAGFGITALIDGLASGITDSMVATPPAPAPATGIRIVPPTRVGGSGTGIYVNGAGTEKRGLA